MKARGNVRWAFAEAMKLPCLACSTDEESIEPGMPCPSRGGGGPATPCLARLHAYRLACGEADFQLRHGAPWPADTTDLRKQRAEDVAAEAEVHDIEGRQT